MTSIRRQSNMLMMMSQDLTHVSMTVSLQVVTSCVFLQTSFQRNQDSLFFCSLSCLMFKRYLEVWPGRGTAGGKKRSIIGGTRIQDHVWLIHSLFFHFSLLTTSPLVSSSEQKEKRVWQKSAAVCRMRSRFSETQTHAGTHCACEESEKDSYVKGCWMQHQKAKRILLPGLRL